MHLKAIIVCIDDTGVLSEVLRCHKRTKFTLLREQYRTSREFTVLLETRICTFTVYVVWERYMWYTPIRMSHYSSHLYSVNVINTPSHVLWFVAMRVQFVNPNSKYIVGWSDQICCIFVTLIQYAKKSKICVVSIFFPNIQSWKFQY